MDSIATTAESLAGSPFVNTAVGQAIRRSITDLASGPQSELMANAAALRERVVALSSTVQRLDEAIPLIDLPGNVTGAVDDLDARLTELGEAVDSVRDGRRRRYHHGRAGDQHRRDPPARPARA